MEDEHIATQRGKDNEINWLKEKVWRQEQHIKFEESTKQHEAYINIAVDDRFNFSRRLAPCMINHMSS